MVPFAALSIPLVAIVLSHRQKAGSNRVREFELQKEILDMEIEKKKIELKILEEENRKYDNEINEMSEARAGRRGGAADETPETRARQGARA
jgi:cell division protein FtsB